MFFSWSNKTVILLAAVVAPLPMNDKYDLKGVQSNSDHLLCKQQTQMNYWILPANLEQFDVESRGINGVLILESTYFL